MMKPADVSSLRVLRQARDRIDREYAEPIGIPALAAGAGYPREHFIRAFRAAYGETPGRYRTRRRVERQRAGAGSTAGAHRNEPATVAGTSHDPSGLNKSARRVSGARCRTGAV
jgi:methylphosphotriester-DNA--protein-cysteine methyltransferase